MTRIAVFCACAAIVSGCDRKSPPPPPSPEPSPGTEQITGNERLGWDQLAATAAELATFRYLIYVDASAGTEVQDVSCASTPGAAGFACSGRLPAMTAGAHTLALSAFIEAGTRLESARSSSLSVIVVGQAPASSRPGQTTVTTADGVQLRAVVATKGLDEPTDLAFTADGRIFIAERAGRVRAFHDGRLLSVPAVTLGEARAADRQELLAIALAPDFERTGFAYVVYAAEAGFRLARFRAVGDRLSERVTLIDNLAPLSRQPAASLRFGPDAKLYVGLDDGDAADAAGDLGSHSGKVLRLNADGTTPTDQAGGTPVFALNVNRPRGLDWDSSGTLWIVETGRLHAIVAETREPRRGSPAARYSLPQGTGASALGFYHAALIPAFRGDLLIAAGDSRSILRLRLDAADPTKVVSAERLLLDAFGPIRAIGVGPDGAIYFCTADALVRLAPDLPAAP